MEEHTEKFAAFWQYAEKHKPAIEKGLKEHLPLAPPRTETPFNEAVEDALSSDRSRLRPILVLLAAELFGGKPELMIPASVACEFIHTSSLILDHLPSMGNSPMRREKSLLHEKFGEGLAILVAVGFLNASYALVFVNHANLPERAMLAHAELVECVGASGMVGGRSVDLGSAGHADGQAAGQRGLARNLRTSAVMRLSLRVGAILAGANSLDLVRLSRFAELLGDAYQLSGAFSDVDADIESVVGGQRIFTRTQRESGTEGHLQKTIEDAKVLLVETFPASEARSCLIQLTDYLAERHE